MRRKRSRASRRRRSALRGAARIDDVLDEHQRLSRVLALVLTRLRCGVRGVFESAFN
jgi:hypothetical protein